MTACQFEIPACSIGRFVFDLPEHRSPTRKTPASSAAGIWLRLPRRHQTDAKVECYRSFELISVDLPRDACLPGRSSPVCAGALADELTPVPEFEVEVSDGTNCLPRPFFRDC